MSSDSSRATQRRITLVVATVYLVLLALDIWLVFFLAEAKWQEKVGFVLQVLGLFALALGFISQAELSKNFSNLLESMTSTNLRNFLYGNGLIVMIAQGFLSVMINGKLFARGWYSHIPLIWLLVGVLVYGGILLYYVLILPLTYLAYLVAAIPLLLVRDSEISAKITVGRESVDVRDLVTEHMVPLKSFTVAVAATMFSFALNGVSLY